MYGAYTNSSTFVLSIIVYLYFYMFVVVLTVCLSHISTRCNNKLSSNFLNVCTYMANKIDSDSNLVVQKTLTEVIQRSNWPQGP